MFGAIVGKAVEMGVKRGLYSNEAGQGTGPHAAAAAEVSHPANRASLSRSPSTSTPCSSHATAFLIISTDMYQCSRPRSLLTRVACWYSSQRRSSERCFAHAFHGRATFVGDSHGSLLRLHPTSPHDDMAQVSCTYLNGTPEPPGAPCPGAGSPGAHPGCRGRRLGDHHWQRVGARRHRRGCDGLAERRGDPDLQGPCSKALKDYRQQKKQGLDPQFDPRNGSRTLSSGSCAQTAVPAGQER